MLSVLLIDDEIKWMESFKKVLSNYKITSEDNIFTARNGSSAMEILSDRNINIVFLDLILENEHGEDVLKLIRSEFPEVTVVIMTGMNDIFTAVTCMREGAADYLVKTATVEEHIASVKRVGAMCELIAENKALKKSIFSDHAGEFDRFVTCSPKMFTIFKYLSAIVTSKEPVLICGESGVGKGVLVKAFASVARKGRPFVSVNIAGLDEQIFSDTLFGHIKGAYTGAEHNRTGLIQQAENGVIFLDEIGELPMSLQVKLLYLLQERVYQQLGSDNVRHSEARFILATNDDLRKKQEAGLFRKDLFYRISTHSVTIPPLRERRNDIPLLFEHFLKEISSETAMPIPHYDDTLIYFLMKCDFPGNVRELRSAVYNAVLKGGSTLTVEDFHHLDNGLNMPANTFTEENILPTVNEIVNQLIYEAMRRSGNNQRKAASLIGLSQSTLSRKLRM